MDTHTLEKIVATLMKQPKGILAIDESIRSCNKRFEALGVATTEENRRNFREMLITTPTIEEYVSGYILFDETIRQATTDGKAFPKILKEKGIEVGIKVDTGLQSLALHTPESVTEGLDGLRERLTEYRDSFGATFCKWRAEYVISDHTPSGGAMSANAHALARYAALCQEAGLVPIVEPEIMMTGDHSIEQCFAVTAQNLDFVFHELQAQGVYLPGMILKSNMVIAGKKSPAQASPKKVAELTVTCFLDHVPHDVGGIVFLSGGQDEKTAQENLHAVGMLEKKGLPWEITFSFGRAIQQPALEAWAKDMKSHERAQQLLLERARANSFASIGEIYE
jgi:fructose-bisphosphate aldolase, class I